MFDLSQLAGFDVAFEYQGKKYDLREMDFEKGAKFSKWVKDRAKAEAARTESLPGEFDRTVASVVIADIAAGHYDWGGPVCAKAMFSPEGAAYALHVALADAEEPPDMEACRQIVKTKLNEIAEFLIAQAELPKESSARKGPSETGATSSPGATTSKESETAGQS